MDKNSVFSCIPLCSYKIGMFAVIVLFTLPFLLKAQDKVTLRNGKKIKCKITKVDSTAVFYDFFKGDRKLSSFTALADVQKYQLNNYEAGSAKDMLQGYPAETVVVDTSKNDIGIKLELGIKF